MLSRTLLAAVPAAILLATAGPAATSDAASWAGTLNGGTAPLPLEFCPEGDVTVLGGGHHDIDVSGPSVLTRFKAERIGAPGAPLIFRVARMQRDIQPVGWKMTASVPAKLDASGSADVPTRIPVQNSDRLALTKPAGSRLACATESFGETPFVAVAPGLMPDGTASAFTTVFDRTTLFAAQIEDDVDEDGFGDDSQDRCIGQPGSVRGCRPGASKRRKCRVPRVVGLPLPTAKQRLAANGCRAGTLRLVGPRGGPMTVRAQARKPRTTLAPGAKIALTVTARR